MVAVELERIRAHSSTADLGRECFRILQVLGFEPPADKAILDPSWRLQIGGHDLFALAFAPFYPTSHPRHTPTAHGFLVLQFEESFSRHRIRTSPTRRALSEFVARRFTDRGMAYFAEITTVSAKAFRLVKPLSEGEDAIAWWRLVGR